MLITPFRKFALLLVAASLLAACQTSQPSSSTTQTTSHSASQPTSHVEAAVIKDTPDKVVPKYLTPDSINLRTLLPDPPAAGSPYSDGELAVIRAAQSDASSESRARAIAEDNMKVWLFAEILGPSFDAKAKPKTAAFIKQIERDSSVMTGAAKKIWNRTRPFVQDPGIKPLITDVPTSGSYPSGHTTRAALWGETLVLLAPDQADAIRARARLIGLDRIILGVHFPSDVAAGNALGKAIVEEMKKSAEFQRDLEEARSEWK